jgi:hypothetical protein
VNAVMGPPLEIPSAAAYHRRFAHPLRPKILTFGQLKDDAAKNKVKAVLGRAVEDATPQLIEKHASIAGISALSPKPSRDWVNASPPLRRGKTVSPASSARTGRSSPRKQGERSVSPDRFQEKTSQVELHYLHSMLDAKKAERALSRTATAPAVATVASLRSDHPSMGERSARGAEARACSHQRCYFRTQAVRSL